MDQLIRTEPLQVILNWVPSKFGERGHDLLKRTASVRGNVISQSPPVAFADRFPFDRLCGRSRRGRIEPLGQDWLAMARSIQNTQSNEAPPQTDEPCYNRRRP